MVAIPVVPQPDVHVPTAPPVSPAVIRIAVDGAPVSLVSRFVPVPVVPSFVTVNDPPLPQGGPRSGGWRLAPPFTKLPLAGVATARVAIIASVELMAA